jgi:hypothetical protein
MYLWILVPKMMSQNIERIVSCLWSTVEKFVLLLDAFKYVEMALWAANETANDDCVQLCGGPQGALLVRDVKFLTKISANPLC